MNQQPQPAPTAPVINPRPSSKSEKQIQNEILLAFATRSDMRLWRANTGYGLTMDRQRMVHFGVTGQADLSGILPGGRRLEIEVKTPEGRQSQEQKNYQAMIERFGGVYVLARSVDDVYAGLRAKGVDL